MSETALTASSRPSGASRPGAAARLAGALCEPDFSRAVALTGMLLGAMSGLAMGLWSFGGPLPEPGWVGGYGDLPRRLLRLGHIALFALGMINLMLARQLAASGLGEGATRLAFGAMNLGNVLMPAVLFAAVFRPEMKYLLALPALAVSFALTIAAFGAWRQWGFRRTARNLRR
jgi:hypothetical protein